MGGANHHPQRIDIGARSNLLPRGLDQSNGNAGQVADHQRCLLVAHCEHHGLGVQRIVCGCRELDFKRRPLGRLHGRAWRRRNSTAARPTRKLSGTAAESGAATTSQKKPHITRITVYSNAEPAGPGKHEAI